MTSALATLNQAALVTLADCEQRIERGLKTFIDVGQALAEIRDSRLYKGTHDTFEAYCRERWNMTDGRARQLMIAAATVTNVAVEGVPAPTNEGQARALSVVPEPERAEVWRETVERTHGKPTAKAVREVAAERTHTPESVAAPSTAPADSGPDPLAGVGDAYRADPAERIAAVAEIAPEFVKPVDPPPGSPATWTDEQREANRDEIERKQAIAACERAADTLVLDLRCIVTTIIDGLSFGAPGIPVTMVMLDECRAELDRLEAAVIGA